MPGVRAVFVAADLNPDVAELWYTGQGRHGPTTPLPLLADGEVRFVGDPVALVIADDRYIAEDAAELVVVDYEPRPAVVDYTTAADQDELVHEGYPRNIVGEMQGGKRADVEEALASAAHVVEHTIYQQAYAAVPLETRGIVAEWDAQRAAHDLGGHAGAARGAVGVLARARSRRSTASGSSCATPVAGSGRRSCRSARSCASRSRRGRCPHRSNGSRTGARTCCRRARRGTSTQPCASRSTTTARSSRRRSTTPRTSAPTRSRGRSRRAPRSA